jgi:bacterioferritin
MKGHPDVIAHLQRLLANELAAIDQYFVHSRMYEDWGLLKLFERIDHESTEEKEHASALIRRMLFLEATPDLSERDALHVGRTVPEMLTNDLQVEYTVAEALKEAIVCCEQNKDFQTRTVLLQLLRDTEEDHAYWLEQQLGLIEKVGLENYLQSQMQGGAAA